MKKVNLICNNWERFKELFVYEMNHDIKLNYTIMKKLVTLLLILFAGVFSLYAQNCDAGYVYWQNPTTQEVEFYDSSYASSQIEYYYWTFGDGSSGSGSSVTHSYSASGYYGVCLDILTSDSCSSSYCDTIYVNVDGDPCANFMLDLAVTNTTFPNAADGGISAIVSGGAQPYVYSWSNGDVTQNIANLTEGQYSITVTDVNGCVVTGTAYVGADSTFSCQAQYWVSDSVGTYFFYDNSVGDVVSWNWTFTGGTPATSTSQNPMVTYNTNGAFDVCLEITTSDGCSSVMCDSIWVGPVCDLYVFGNSHDVTTQGGSDGYIDITISGGTQPYSINWSHWAQTEDVSGLTSGQYFVEVIDSESCSYTAYFYINEPYPDSCYLQIDYIVVDESAPGAADGMIDITVSGGFPPFMYIWSNGEYTEDISNLTSGFYDVLVYDSLYCQETMNFYVAEASTYVPVDTLWTDPVDTCINITDFYIDTVSVTDSNFVDVTWALIDDNGTTYLTVTYPYDQTGYVTVTLQINCPNGAKNITAIYDVIEVEYNMITGIENSEINYLRIYPNPVKDNFVVDARGATEIVIRNITGQVIHAQKVNDESVVEVGSLSKGLYFITISFDGGETETLKIIKN